MRGKISIISEKKPRFAPVFRIFSPFSAFLRIRPLPSEIDMRLCVFLCTRPCACLCACPASAFAAQALPVGRKEEPRPSFPYYIYCLPIRTAQDFSTRRAFSPSRSSTARKNRAPENRSKARFLGKRSGRRDRQGGKHSAPTAMAP